MIISKKSDFLTEKRILEILPLFFAITVVTFPRLPGLLNNTTTILAFDIVSKKTDKTPIDFFHEALNNVKPSLEVRSRRVGGATYQVPMEVRPKRAQTLAMKWIVDSALKRNEKTMKERIANEIVDAFNNKGNSVKKREETHKMAEANRAFSHFRW